MVESGVGDDPDMTVADEYNLSYSIEPLDKNSYSLDLGHTVLLFMFAK